MGELEWDLFSSKFYLTGTEGSKNLREKKQAVEQSRVGEQHF